MAIIPGTTSHISGTPGDDTLSGMTGSDIIFGLEGNDSIQSGGGASWIYGNQGNDSIRGGFTTGSETVYGGQGQDHIDFQYAASGSRVIYGNLGEDFIVGSHGNDVIFGGQGNDVIQSLGGANLIYGNAGNDRIFGDFAGRVTVYAGQGDDLLGLSSSGTALVYGNLGSDDLRGSGGNDTIYGGQGDDNITAQQGADLLSGNLGADKFIFYAGPPPAISTSTVDTITDFVTGTDELSLNAAAINTGPGTTTNFRAVTFSGSDLASAASAANSPGGFNGSAAIDYVFVANLSGEGGYLFIDRDNSGTIDSSDDAIAFTTGTVQAEDTR